MELFNQQNSLTDRNLVFGRDVHILDGSNHDVLGMLLGVGITISFAVSGTAEGLRKHKSKVSETRTALNSNCTQVK